MRSKKGNERPLLATFLAVSFVLGALLGAVIASTWIQGVPSLQLSEGEVYIRSITIVGVDKTTGEGRLATLTVELRAGSGRLMIAPPPYENEDTQAAALKARKAADQEITQRLNLNLDESDVIISIENLSDETTIAGPSASASVAVLIVAAVNASEGETPNQVRQDVVVSASINEVGRLEPVGEIAQKYQAVRDAGTYTCFVVAEDQPGNLPNYPGISVVKIRNLSDLVDEVLW